MNKRICSSQLFALILTVIVCPMAKVAAENSHPFLRRPDVHVDQLVFTSESDLWLASISTGLSRRITTPPGLETNAHFLRTAGYLHLTPSMTAGPTFM